MATYFNKYYFEFQDAKLATWRVDIMDSEGSTPTEPFLLEVTGQPLITERIDVNEDKKTSIIGRQITISYIFTGLPGIPAPEEFFEANERRFRVEVRKDGVIDGVYWIKPDYCEYPFHSPPYGVQLKAVDGLSFASGVKFNMDGGSGLLKYDKISLYEAMMTRGLFQVIDPNTPVNVLQSLYPGNIEPGQRMLFGLFVHTDIFYDFVEGANSVRDVEKKIADNFYARLFLAKGEVWFIRTQDLKQASYVVDRYTDDTTVTSSVMPDFVKTVGPDFSFDGMPVSFNGKNRGVPAIKQADYEVEYKGINQVKNFDWAQWDGTNFTEWSNVSGLDLDRLGAGSQDDPYRAFIPYTASTIGNEPSLFQTYSPILVGPFSQGDTVDFEIKIQLENTQTFQIGIVFISGAGGSSPQVLTGSGAWLDFFPNGIVDESHRIQISRSGKKKDASFKIKSLPLPGKVGANPIFQIFLMSPNRLADIPDGSPVNGVTLYPIKIGVISMSSHGRHVRAINEAEFSHKEPIEKITFIDTGEGGVSNTIFTGISKIPAQGWDSTKPGVTPRDIELHLADSPIDQYSRSIKGIDCSIYSNTIDFFNVIEFSSLPGVTFMQIGDKYNNRTCEHDLRLLEVFEEGTATADITEWDIEDVKD